jgi:hypothetical protein
MWSRSAGTIDEKDEERRDPGHVQDRHQPLWFAPCSPFINTTSLASQQTYALLLLLLFPPPFILHSLSFAQLAFASTFAINF